MILTPDSKVVENSCQGSKKNASIGSIRIGSIEFKGGPVKQYRLFRVMSIELTANIIPIPVSRQYLGDTSFQATS